MDKEILGVLEPVLIMISIILYHTKGLVVAEKLYSMLVTKFIILEGKTKFLFSFITVVFLSWIWIFLVSLFPRNLHITKLLYLIQGWAPGTRIFQDSLIFGDAINCASKVNLFQNNPCMTFKWNYPNYVSSMPSWQFWWLVYLMLFFLSYFYVITQIYSMIKKIKYNLLGLILIASPPFLYAIERGSLDLQVAAALIFLYKTNYKYKNKVNKSMTREKNVVPVKVTFIACVIFTYLSVIKFYPVVFFVLALFSLKKTSRIVVFVFFILNLVLAIFWLDAPNFLPVNNPYNNVLPVGLLNYLRFVSGSLLLLILLIAVFFMLIKKSQNFFIPKTNLINFFTYLPLMIFMSFWVLAGSASYRPVLLLVFLVLFWHEKNTLRAAGSYKQGHASLLDSEITFLVLGILFTIGLPIICNTLILLLFFKLILPLLTLCGLDFQSTQRLKKNRRN